MFPSRPSFDSSFCPFGEAIDVERFVHGEFLLVASSGKHPQLLARSFSPGQSRSDKYLFIDRLDKSMRTDLFLVRFEPVERSDQIMIRSIDDQHLLLVIEFISQTLLSTFDELSDGT